MREQFRLVSYHIGVFSMNGLKKSIQPDDLYPISDIEVETKERKKIIDPSKFKLTADDIKFFQQ